MEVILTFEKMAEFYFRRKIRNGTRKRNKLQDVYLRKTSAAYLDCLTYIDIVIKYSHAYIQYITIKCIQYVRFDYNAQHNKTIYATPTSHNYSDNASQLMFVQTIQL